MSGQTVDSKATDWYIGMKRLRRSDDLAIEEKFGCRIGNAALLATGQRQWGIEMEERLVLERVAFGLVLKDYREVRRVSQSKLAVRAGFDHSYVSRLESGARTPTRDAVAQLADALELDGVNHDKLLVAAGYLPREVSSLLAEEPEITDVLNLLQNLDVPEPYRASMRQVLRSLADQARLVLNDAKVPSAGVAA